MTEESKLYCYLHPDRETMLRCNQCERPICTRCAVLTPTGYRCKECIQSQQKKFETTTNADLVIAPLIAAGLSFAGSLIAPRLGFFTLFLAPLVGMAVVEVCRRVTNKRRSVRLTQLVSGAALVGSLPYLALTLLSFFRLHSGLSVVGLLPLVWQAAYTFLVTSSVYYRLSGIRIG